MAITHPTSSNRLLTADDLEAMGSDAEQLELFAGVLRARDGAGMIHGEVSMEILVSLARFVRDNGLGVVLPAPTHFVVSRNPDTVLVADAAFVRSDRLPPRKEWDRVAQVPPELAVEVIDPRDLYDHVVEKIACYQAAGVPLVWLVEPRRRLVAVYVLDQEPRTLREGDILDGGDVVPGFRLPVVNIFAS